MYRVEGGLRRVMVTCYRYNNGDLCNHSECLFRNRTRMVVQTIPWMKGESDFLSLFVYPAIEKYEFNADKELPDESEWIVLGELQ